MSKQKQIEPQRGSGAFDDFVNRTFGEGVVVPASMVVERPRAIVPTCLTLDIALSGGIPEGKIVLMSGKPKAGKTTLCLEILANAILMGRKAFYANIERRCDAALLKTINRLDPSKLTMMGSTEEHILTAEQWFHLLERTVKDWPGCVVVVDSLAMLSTLAEQSEATGENKDMAGVPKLLANFFRKIKDIVDTNNCVMVFITQYQTNRDPMSKRKFDEKGGIGVQYACSVWLQADWFQVWQKEASTQESYGQDVHFTVRASALGKPYRPCCIPLRFGEGVDRPRGIATYAENLGLIEKSGAWYRIPMFAVNDAAPKFQGGEQLRAFLVQNPDKMYALEREIRRIVIPDSVQYADQAAQRLLGAGEPGEVPVAAKA